MFVEMMMSKADVARAWVGRYRESLLLGAVLVVSSVVALGVLALRIAYTGAAGYSFMVWNLFLAWIPLWLAVAIAAVARGGRRAYGLVAGLGMVWLLFFPNAPYLLTEFIHLDADYAVRERPVRLLAGVSPGKAAPAWYDAALILMFAWNGLLLAFVSLHLVQRVVRRIAGTAWSWAAAVAVLGLSAFGMSLGRFERWNSWDLLMQPTALLADVMGRVLNPVDHPRTTAGTVIFASFWLMSYLAVQAMGAMRNDEGRVLD